MGSSTTPSRPRGQWFASRSGSRWFFDSGALALDFAYTGGMGGDPGWERLHAPADLDEWMLERFPEVDAQTTDGELADALTLRAAISRTAVAASSGRPVAASDIDVVNLYAATPDIPPALAGGSRQAGRRRARVGQALSELAREAVFLFGDESVDRIRECAADDCGIVFYDESRSRNRRWCSMQRCGNRTKVRAHRARG